MYMHILFHVYSDKQKQVGSIIVVTDPLDKDVTESVNRDSSHDDKDVHVHTHVSTNTNYDFDSFLESIFKLNSHYSFS